MYKIKRFTSIKGMKKFINKSINNSSNESVIKKLYGKPISQKTSAKLAKDDALRKLNASATRRIGLKLDRNSSDALLEMTKDSMNMKRNASIKVGGRMKKFKDAMIDESPF